MTMIKIRNYRDDDLDILISVWEAASKVGHPFSSNEFINSERLSIPSVYLPNGNTSVAILNSELVGFSISHGNEIGALFVLPKHHGNGVAYALMQEMKNLFATLKVEVFENNKVARYFYQRQGFQLIDQYFHKDANEVMLGLRYSRDV